MNKQVLTKKIFNAFAAVCTVHLSDQIKDLIDDLDRLATWFNEISKVA